MALNTAVVRNCHAFTNNIAEYLENGLVIWIVNSKSLCYRSSNIWHFRWPWVTFKGWAGADSFGERGDLYICTLHTPFGLYQSNFARCKTRRGQLFTGSLEPRCGGFDAKTCWDPYVCSHRFTYSD